MATIIHLEPEEFVENLYIQHGVVRVSPFVLECGIAGMIYMFTGTNKDVYYMDRIFTSSPKINNINKQILHADIYRKVALDQSMKKII